MYKNFKLNDEERKEILEQHGKYGYRKPLNENMSHDEMNEIDVRPPNPKPGPNTNALGPKSSSAQVSTSASLKPKPSSADNRINNIATMISSIVTKNVPTMVINNPKSGSNGMKFTDYVKQFKVTRQEILQAAATLKKFGMKIPKEVLDRPFYFGNLSNTNTPPTPPPQQGPMG